MLNYGAVSHDVGIVHRHANLNVKCIVFPDGRLVHVVPSAVEVIRSLEVFALVKRTPESGSIVIEVVNPDSWARPAYTYEYVNCIWLKHKDVGVVCWVLCFVLHRHSF